MILLPVQTLKCQFADEKVACCCTRVAGVGGLHTAVDLLHKEHVCLFAFPWRVSPTTLQKKSRSIKNHCSEIYNLKPLVWRRG